MLIKCNLQQKESRDKTSLGLWSFFIGVAAASDKVYQLLAQGRWFSPGTPASSTTKAGRHDIAEILLKVALNTKNSNSDSLLVCLLLVLHGRH